MKARQKSAKSTTTSRKGSKVFTEEERDAMKERAREIKAASDKEDGESAVQAKIAEMADSDRAMAKRLHALIKASAPDLSPRLWYGMPAYAKDGKTLCFFQPAQKFKTRYATFGFNDVAKLDEGTMWPVAYALTKVSPADESTISGLLKKAVS
jgi:hypothetical protein